VNPSTTNITLAIDDGSGKMEARMWVDPDDTSEFTINKRNSLREGIYVKIVGHMRSFQNKRSIYASHIIPITDFNEVTYHFLEVMFVHLSSTQVIPPNSVSEFT
jgi:replication factor A2